jgi:hypothetical protein
VRPDVFSKAPPREGPTESDRFDRGLGVDVSVSAAIATVPLDEINWSPMPVETLPPVGSPVEPRTIAYREIAQAAVHVLHEVYSQHAQLLERHHRALDEIRELRRSGTRLSSGSAPESQPRPMVKRVRFSLAGIPGLRGVSGIRKL